MRLPPKPFARRAAVQLRYLAALLWRFKVTFVFLAVVLLGGSLAIWLGHDLGGRAVSFPKALGATYFLMMGQPSLELPDAWWLMLVEVAIPILGLAVVADGVVRFGYLFFAKHRNDKEWIAVLAQTYRDHVVLCGAGRVGYRVLEQLVRLKLDVVVVEHNENAPFVQAIRAQKVPLLIGDVRAEDVLLATNIAAARALVCATDDDLANMNIALDARRLNPAINVVMRLFDDDLVRKVREAFKVEALSTSALAAPAFAAAAFDPSIRTSFALGEKLIVVAELPVGPLLAGRTVAQARDDLGVLVLEVAREGAGFATPRSADVLRDGDLALVQATVEEYVRLRGARAPG